jgi:site-specific DNA-methyltransferase (adenine-specific)
VGNLRPTYEPILWFTKPYKIGTTIADNALTYGVGAYNEAALLRYQTNPENVLNYGLSAQEGGLHPNQKPVLLLQALIELTTQEKQIVLDPFCGSGSTLVAAKNTGRHFIGWEANEQYHRIALSRLGITTAPHRCTDVF